MMVCEREITWNEVLEGSVKVTEGREQQEGGHWQGSSKLFGVRVQAKRRPGGLTFWPLAKGNRNLVLGRTGQLQMFRRMNSEVPQ